MKQFIKIWLLPLDYNEAPIERECKKTIIPTNDIIRIYEHSEHSILHLKTYKEIISDFTVERYEAPYTLDEIYDMIYGNWLELKTEGIDNTSELIGVPIKKIWNDAVNMLKKLENSGHNVEVLKESGWILIISPKDNNTVTK